MAREIRADMYEGNLARRQGYDTDYDSREYGGAKAGRRDSTCGRYGSRPQGGGDRYDSWSRAPGNGKAARSSGAGSRRKRRVQRRILTGIILYFLLAGIVATCWMIAGVFVGDDEKVHAESAMADGVKAAGKTEFSEEEEQGGNDRVLSPEVTPQIRQECQELYARQGELLLLVNKDHELQESYKPILHSICKGRLEAADILYEDLCDMLKDAGEAGYEFWIASAHRDRSYQQGLVDEDVQKYMSKGYSYKTALEKTYEYTMPAGASEHETGLAIDILCSTNTIMDESQACEPGNRWLAEHCHEYGFILRYPEDREDITGISYEPWHFRYVGKEAAAYLTQKGWTLEEFHEVVSGMI